jgi:hypothetical protein
MKPNNEQNNMEMHMHITLKIMVLMSTIYMFAQIWNEVRINGEFEGFIA